MSPLRSNSSLVQRWTFPCLLRQYGDALRILLTREPLPRIEVWDRAIAQIGQLGRQPPEQDPARVWWSTLTESHRWFPRQPGLAVVNTAGCAFPVKLTAHRRSVARKDSPFGCPV